MSDAPDTVVPPDVVAFDVNETLSDMAPMADRFADVGAEPALAKLWFASLLRDGFALGAAGDASPFRDIAPEVLRTTLAGCRLDRDLDAAVEHVMDGFAELSVHDDVRAGIVALAGLTRVVTLSNGASAVAERLFERAGLHDHVERFLSVDDAGAWKPARAPYRYAASACAVDPGQMMLVAVHPWDIHGARRAGLRTAWVNRGGDRYPAYFSRPEVEVTSVGQLAGLWGA